MDRDHLFLPKLSKVKWISISLGLICTTLVLLAKGFNIPIASPFLTELDNKIYDQIVTLNWHEHKPIPRVVIIDIDEQSIQKEGRWPWRRDRMAELLNKLKKDGVVTVGMDIVMSEAEINYALGLKQKLQQLTPQSAAKQTPFFDTLDKVAPQVDSDQALAHSLSDHSVVLGFLFQNEVHVKKGVLPPYLTDPKNTPLDARNFPSIEFKGYNGSVDLLMNAATKGGFVTNLPDIDGTVRHALLLANHNGKLYPNLALATAMNYLFIDHMSLVTQNKKLTGIQLDGIFIPTNSRGQILIPFWGGPGTLDYYSATNILQDKVDSKDLQGAIAIIGSSITLLADLHESPVTLMFPGVEMVGNIVQAIVSQQIAVQYNWNTFGGTVFIILYGVFFSILLPLINIYLALLITLVTLFLALSGSVFMFVVHNIYIPNGVLLTLSTLLALVNYSYSFIIEKRQKQKISHLFGQYVPGDYLKELIDSPESFSMEGQTRDMTVQFSDIRNFTSLSENLDASSVKRLLNTFFTPITEIIFKHRGTIDKYVGDMIVAFWGAPIEDEEHAYHAILSSLSVFAHLGDINMSMKQIDLPEVHIGIGLASGLMNVGDMGSEFRRAYTVLGDTVNLASRLQDLTKFYQVDILVNDLTRKGQDKILWRTIDKVAVKGRRTALTIYQPLCLVSEASPELLEEVEEYHLALKDYYAQDWLSAEKRFEELKTRHQDIYIYRLYLDRILSFKQTPPPKDWDGVYIHLHK